MSKSENISPEATMRAVVRGDRDRWVKLVMFCCAAISFLGVLMIFLFIFRESLPAITKVGIPKLFLSTDWRPKSGHYGMLAFTFGTIFTTVVAMIVAAPLGIGAAIFIDQIAPDKVGRAVRRVIELLAGIPSVVIGWFGLILLVPFLRNLTGSSGFGMGAASLVLVVMSLPTITTLSAESLKAVPTELKEASAAMGATRWQSIYKVIMPSAREGIVIAVVLGMGRAIGETMAVQMVIGNASQATTSLVQPGSTLTTRIVQDLGEASGVFRSALFAQALMLLLLSIFLIICIRWISRERKS